MTHLPKVLIIGPTPPPYIGPAVATKAILESDLKNRFALLHSDTSDRRSIRHIGKLDFRNIYLTLLHIFKLFCLLLTAYPVRLIYFPICQSVRGYLRDMAVIFLSWIFGCRVIIHLRGGYFRTLYEQSNLFIKFMIKFSLLFVRRAIVLGESLKYIFDGLVPKERIVVVPNGLAEDYITEEDLNKAQKNKIDQIDRLICVNQCQYLRPSVNRVLFLSNLMLSKGLFDIIQSVPEVVRNQKGVEFIFAGEFDEAENVHRETLQYINGHGLNSYIKFMGTTTGKTKKDLLLSSDIFAFPTYAEGQPWVIIEAMAAGLPIITTDQGCIKEMVIDGENGFIVDKHSPEQIAEKIILLLKDENLRRRMGRKSRERFLRYYTKDKFINGLAQVFTEVLKE